MQHTFGLKIVEIGGEESQGGSNGFREVVHGELLLSAARWDIFRYEVDRSESMYSCMDTHKPEPIKALLKIPLLSL